MPIQWDRLRVSVVTDAAWGNAKGCIWVEDNETEKPSSTGSGIM